jgi:adenosylcobinamide-GDP ribazoletransferase
MAQILKQLIRDLLACMRFFTRLPLPALPFEADIHAMLDFKVAVRMLPFAGMVVGMIGGLSLWIGHRLHLPPLVNGIITCALLTLVTGGLHEDGLADIADGFGGGATRARKLEIMKDSRLGTYGVLALVFSVLLKVAALSALVADFGISTAIGAVIAAASLSRGLCLLPLCLLAPARADGAAAAAARPTVSTQIFIAASGLALTLVFAGGGAFGLGHSILALACAGLASYGLTRLAQVQIGGHTGDVAGATQHITEITFLVALLVA